LSILDGNSTTPEAPQFREGLYVELIAIPYAPKNTLVFRWDIRKPALHTLPKFVDAVIEL
jgi:hypothetical protein